MLSNNLLELINFSCDDVAEYYKYYNIAGKRVAPVAEGFMKDKLSFDEAFETLSLLAGDNIHRFTVDLLFVLECTSYVLEKYKQQDIPYDIFINSMKDIKYKLDECKTVKNVFGTYVLFWFIGFLKLKRFGLGRLQFEAMRHTGEEVVVNGYKIKNGDFCINCHIPSAGPLNPELCIQAYKNAYDFYKNNIKPDGVLPVRCSSWLLLPEYKGVFSKGSNIAEFSKNYTIVGTKPSNVFSDGWRIFGTEDISNADLLPKRTSLQRTFIDYMKKSNDFGEGIGYVLVNKNGIISN